MAITVAKDAAKLLIKILPSKTRLNKRSGLCSNLCAFIAPGRFSLTKCLKRYRFNDIKAVSDPAKKAERISMRASMPNSILRGISFKESVLWGCENGSSFYYENFLSSLNANVQNGYL